MSLPIETAMRWVRQPEEHFPQRTRYYGIYYGLVEDNRDPLRLGRLRIRTPVHPDVEGVSTEALPWAFPITSSGGNPNIGHYFIPPIGSMTAVGFSDGNPSYPAWYGTVWGAPGGIPETLVSNFDELDPYGLQDSNQTLTWDYTQVNTISTPSGHRLVLDDNVGEDAGRLTNYRRISIETPGDVTIAYSSLVAPFSVGKLVAGERSLAEGRIVESNSSELVVSVVSGTFRIGEKIRDTGGGEATVDATEVDRQFYLRMREDRDLVGRSATEKFRGLFEMGTPDGRIMEFDDEDEVIVIRSPDEHEIRIDSVDDSIQIQTENDHYMRFDDPGAFIEIATLGDDPEEKGYRIKLDEANKRLTIKGDEEHYFLEMDENNRRFGMYSPYQGEGAGEGRHAGIEMTALYAGNGSEADVVRVYANDNRGRRQNGLLVDRGDISSTRPKSVYFYDTNDRTPDNHIRLITEQLAAPGVDSGQVDIGQRAGSTFLRLRPVTQLAVLSSSAVEIRGGTVSVGPSGPTNNDTIELVGGFVSKYFKHVHEMNFVDPQNVLIQYTLTPVSGGTPWTGPTVVQVAAQTANPLSTPPVPRE